jgi:hypothetical protein
MLYNIELKYDIVHITGSIKQMQINGESEVTECAVRRILETLFMADTSHSAIANSEVLDNVR